MINMPIAFVFVAITFIYLWAWMMGRISIKKKLNEQKTSANLVITHMDGEEPYIFMEFLEDVPSKREGELINVRVTHVNK